MTKLIEIENCGECPHCTTVGGVYRCKLHNYRWMDDRYFPEIPAWCTLYDARIIDLYRFTDADGRPEGL
jgi:hypothetical protein